MTNIIATMDDVEGVEQENKVNCTQVLHSKSSIGTTGNPAKTWERMNLQIFILNVVWDGFIQGFNRGSEFIFPPT